MGLLDREYSEKRDFIRMKVETPVNVTLKENNRSLDGVCNDLSGGGMLITMDEHIDLETELIVQVHSSHGHSPMLEARCTVARVKQGSQNSYLIGLEIQEVLDQTENEAS